MRFQWPELLWLASSLPLLMLLYVWLLRRRKKAAVHYPSLVVVQEAVGAAAGWRRHVPPALLLAALGALIIAGARPMAELTLPTRQRTIVMAMDVSGSMRAADVAPDRISASQAAAKAFARELPRNVRIGVVSYAGTAQLVQAPTLSREDVLAAIDRFQLQGGTAIGSGLLVALETLFPRQNIEVPGNADPRNLPPALQPKQFQRKESSEFTPVPPGSHESAAIVLLTDGQNTIGPEPMEVAQVAASRGVKVFTVGFGTKEGETIGFEGWSMRVQLDEDTLKSIANLTHGEYFHAASAADLQKVYGALQSRLVLERRETEITALLAYAAALLMLAGVGLSVWWFGRVA